MFKSVIKKVFSNTLYQVVGKIVSGGAALLVSAMITRNLGGEVFGDYSIVFTYVLMFYMIADFGVNAIVIKEFATNKAIAKEKFTSVLTLRITLGILLILISVVSLAFMPYTKVVKEAILLTLPVILFQSISRATSIIFQSYLKYRQQMIATIIGSLSSLFFVWILINNGKPSVIDLAFVSVISGMFVVMVSLFFVRDYINLDAKKIDLKYWLFVIKDAIPLGMSLFFNIMMVHVDRLVLSVVSTPISVGIYSLSYKIFDVFLVIVTFFMNAMYPILLKAKKESEKKYILLIKYTVVFMSIVAILITTVSINTSGVVIPSIWGADMSGAILPFNILILGSIIFYITSPLSWVLLIEGYQKDLPKIYGIGLLLNTILNLIFIPKYDYVAAAYTTLFTELFVLVVMSIRIIFILRNRKNS